MRIVIAGTMLMAIVRVSLADPTATATERQTLDAFASANTGCREWTDGCSVCARQADAGYACSVPGIACEPRTVACSDEGAPPPAKASR